MPAIENNPIQLSEVIEVIEVIASLTSLTSSKWKFNLKLLAKLE